jgi:hypothetical protein
MFSSGFRFKNAYQTLFDFFADFAEFRIFLVRPQMAK